MIRLKEAQVAGNPAIAGSLIRSVLPAHEGHRNRPDVVCKALIAVEPGKCYFQHLPPENKHRERLPPAARMDGGDIAGKAICPTHASRRRLCHLSGEGRTSPHGPNSAIVVSSQRRVDGQPVDVVEVSRQRRYDVQPNRCGTKPLSLWQGIHVCFYPVLSVSCDGSCKTKVSHVTNPMMTALLLRFLRERRKRV